jgi:hypothetical protein
MREAVQRVDRRTQTSNDGQHEQDVTRLDKILLSL